MKERKLLGYCHSIRGDGRRCGAPAYRTYMTNWLACDDCYPTHGSGHFRMSVSLLVMDEPVSLLAEKGDETE